MTKPAAQGNNRNSGNGPFSPERRYSMDGLAIHELIMDANGRPVDYVFLEVNPAFEQYTGLQAADICGKRVTEVLPGFEDSELIEKYGAVVRRGEAVSFEQFFEPRQRWYRVVAYPMGKNRFATVVADITDSRRAESALVESEKRHAEALSLLTGVLESSEDMVIFALDHEYRYLAFNTNHQETMKHIWGTDITVGSNMLDYITDTADREKAKANFDRALNGESFCVVEQYGDSALNRRWYENTYNPLHDAGGAIIGLTLFLTDVTARKHAEKTLRENEKRFQKMLDAIPDLVSIHTPDMDIVYSNWNGFGAVPEHSQLLNTKCFRTYRGLENICVDCRAVQVFETKEPLQTEVELPNGTWVDLRVIPLKDENDEVELFVEWVRDITEQKQFEQEIEYLSFHDELTGLYNRRFFEAECERLDVARNLPLTLVVLDVDGLKLTNDAFGHQTGDELLRTVAESLKEVCRADDIVARIGGDELAILLPRMDEERAEKTAERIQRALTAETVAELPVSISCGWSTKTGPKQSMADVFKTAEDYMYRDKITKRSSYRHQSVDLIMQTVYARSPQEQEHSRRVSQLCEAMGTALGLSQGEVQRLVTAALLHDIGKIAIGEEVLQKSGSLTQSEWKAIRRHPEVGHNILSAVNDYAVLAEHVLAHHERWDGNGYPKGLAKEAIPLPARIIALADAYDAMVSDRPYRDAMGDAEAMAEIERCAGSQFDPDIVGEFVRVMERSVPPGQREVIER